MRENILKAINEIEEKVVEVACFKKGNDNLVKIDYIKNTILSIKIHTWSDNSTHVEIKKEDLIRTPIENYTQISQMDFNKIIETLQFELLG